MQTFVHNTILQAGLVAGLPDDLEGGRVMSLSASDNITLPRPRIELQFLPEQWARTGRGLHMARTKTQQHTKKELYTAILRVSANVLANDAAWLAAFCPAFVRAMPIGANDAAGNWVKIRVAQATYANTPTKRVGTQAIQVFTKVSQLFECVFTWRVTDEQLTALITTITIKAPHWR